ncbi:MAG: thiamine diphosphokinase [Candidatus Levyibacteriota bacterium]|nr:MAG: thiamine diphosphokinase [Candidatus Levybacteria bacterium]
MRYVIFTGGRIEKGKIITQSLKIADKIIAADSGAKTALEWNYIPEAVIGDMDSIDTKTRDLLKKRGTVFVTYPATKNEADTELAIQYAIDNNATEIDIIGGIEGNRIDHILANISLLAGTNIPVRYIHGAIIAWVEKGPKLVQIKGDINDLLSLIPLSKEVSHITTINLKYSLKNESLFFGKSRGISNIFTQKEVSVDMGEGQLLFVHILNRS